MSLHTMPASAQPCWTVWVLVVIAAAQHLLLYYKHGTYHRIRDSDNTMLKVKSCLRYSASRVVQISFLLILSHARHHLKPRHWKQCQCIVQWTSLHTSIHQSDGTHRYNTYAILIIIFLVNLIYPDFIPSNVSKENLPVQVFHGWDALPIIDPECHATKWNVNMTLNVTMQCTKVWHYLCLFRAKPDIEEYLPCWAHFTMKVLNPNIWIRRWRNIRHVLDNGFTKFGHSYNIKWYNII